MRAATLDFGLWTLDLFSRAKTLAAGTARGGVGIFHLEAAVERADVIQFAAGDVKCAFGINDHAHAAALYKDVAVRRIVLQIHFVLQPGAAAADDRHAQHAVRAALLGEQRRNFLRRARCEFDEPLVANAKIRRGRWFAGEVGNHF
jgi:hypothetical protein